MSEDVIKLVKEYLRENDAAWKRWEPIYRDSLNYLYNAQLEHIQSARKQDWPQVVVNQIFPAVMQEQAIIAMRRPKVVVEPESAEDRPAARLWQALLDWYFVKRLKIPELLQKAVLHGKVYGYWVTKIWWEPMLRWNAEADAWEGDVMVRLVRPEYFVADPTVSDLSDARYIGTRRIITLAEAIQRWPEHKKELEHRAKSRKQAEGDLPELPFGGHSYIAAAGTRVALDGAPVQGERDAGPAWQFSRTRGGRLASLLYGDVSSHQDEAFSTAENQWLQLVELFIRDDSIETKYEDERVPLTELVESGAAVRGELDGLPVYMIGGEPLSDDNWPTRRVKRQRPRWPRGRHLIVVDDYLLNPEPQQQDWPYDLWPFAVGVNHILPHTWRGLPEIEMYADLQDWINEAASHLLNYVKNFGDPRVLVEEGALQGDAGNRSVASKIRAAAGQIIKLARGGLARIRFEPPSSHSQGLVEIVRMYMQFLRDATGIHEIALGRATPGNVTATEALRLESNTRLRVSLQARHLDSFATEVMYRVAELLRRHLSPMQKVRILGENAVQQVIQMESSMFDVSFDLRVDMGTRLPYDDEREQAKALQLFQILGAAYLPQLLEAFQVKDAPQILEALTSMQAQSAQAPPPQARQPAEQGPPEEAVPTAPLGGMATLSEGETLT